MIANSNSNSNTGSASTVVVDLTEVDDNHDDQEHISKKRRLETQENNDTSTNVWLVIHQLESGGYHCVGDYINDRNSNCYSHQPTIFDATICGIYTTRDKANKAAKRVAVDYDIYGINGEEEYESFGNENEEEEDIEDFVGEGRFESGADVGDVNTFSQRVHVISRAVE